MQIILLGIAAILGFLFVVILISALIGVPCLPTHSKQARKMIELASLKDGMKAVDLGSCAGRLLFLAAKSGAKIVGYELNPVLVIWSRLMIRLRGLSKNIRVVMKSVYKADLKNADVIFTFLMNGPMKKLEPKLFSECKPGATIISYTFPIPGHEPVHVEDGIFVYKVGEV